MSEQTIIFIIGVLWSVIQVLMSAILGWLAFELRQLRKDTNHRIHFADCERRMNEHARRLDKIERN